MHGVVIIKDDGDDRGLSIRPLSAWGVGGEGRARKESKGKG